MIGMDPAAPHARATAVALLALLVAFGPSVGLGGEPWLPLPVEEIDRPETLEREGNAAAGFSLRFDSRAGRASLRGATATLARGRSRLHAEISRNAAGYAAGTAIASRSAFSIAVGRVGIRNGPVLLEEWIGSRRFSSRVPPPATRAVTLEPASVAAPSVEGAGFRHAWGTRDAWSLWCVAGRHVETDRYGFQVAGLGARFAKKGSAAHLAAGLLRDAGSFRTQGAASLCWSLRRSGRGMRPWGAAAEALIGPRGASMLLSTWGAAGPLDLDCRWRRRAGDARSVAGETSVEGGPRNARLRLRASGGPSGVSGSVSRLEVECRLTSPFPTAVRCGETRWDQAPPTGPGETVAKRERYWIAEATVARARGRELSLMASRRDRSLPSGAREGTGLGGRLGIDAGGRGHLDLLVQATRAAAGGSAWGSALYAAGPTALRSWSRPGIWAAGRGTLRIGRWTAGGVLETREDGSGGSATAASFWIQCGLHSHERG